MVTSYHEGYGAPAAPALDNYGSPQAPVAPAYIGPAPTTRSVMSLDLGVISTPCITVFSEPAHEDAPIVDLTNEVYIDGVATIDGEPVLSHEPVIHPGGSQAVDYNKVSHVGVHTVVQVISIAAKVVVHKTHYINLV